MESITRELEGIKYINCGKQLPPLGLRQQRKVVRIIKTELRWGSVELKHRYLRKRCLLASACVSKLREMALWALGPRSLVRRHQTILAGGLWGEPRGSWFCKYRKNYKLVSAAAMGSKETVPAERRNNSKAMFTVTALGKNKDRVAGLSCSLAGSL